MSNQESSQVSIDLTQKIKINPILLPKYIEKLSELIFDDNYKPTEKNIKKLNLIANKLSQNEYKIIAYCIIPKKRKEILIECLGISNQTKNFRYNILPLIEKGLLQPTIKDKPQSQHQKYVTSNSGKAVIYIFDQKKGK